MEETPSKNSVKELKLIGLCLIIGGLLAFLGIGFELLTSYHEALACLFSPYLLILIFRLSKKVKKLI